MPKLKTPFGMTVGTKLIALIAILLMGSITTLVLISTRMFVEDNKGLIQVMNADMAAGLSTQMRELFGGITEKMRVLGTALLETTPNTPSQTPIVREFFAKDKDFLAVYLYQSAAGGWTVRSRAISPEMQHLGDSDGAKALTAIAGDKDLSIPQVAKGAVQISTIKLEDSSAAVAIAVPFVQQGDHFTHLLVALVRQNRFLKAFGESDLVTSFMVDYKGKLLAHPDGSRVSAGENVSYLPIVKQLLSGKSSNGQTRYIDPQNKDARLGAFHLVGFGGLGVIAEMPEAKAFEAAKRVEHKSMYLGLVILSLAFLAGYLYSGTITWPLKQLVAVSQRIASGDFDVNLRPKNRDEVSRLALAFNEMAKGLAERDRVKQVFNKFHNKEIAEKLLSGAVNLGGERKEVTIFFSDIRGFTGMSESLEPEQVVEMLNEYMTRMVSIIRSYGGVVDKYVGDAIMALWGVPIGHADDAFNAVRACLAMREELAKLNKLRLSRGQNPIKIGMGLNTGPVIAGNIGSDEKMEYTVIGDSTNLASRVESVTKEYGTDLLISQNVYERISDRFIFEACQSVRVKGKSAPIQLYKVTGYIGSEGQPVIVETPYSSYEPTHSEKVVIPPPFSVPPPFRKPGEGQAA